MDIVERLRNSDDLSDQQITFACVEAADEIERLRAALGRILEIYRDDGDATEMAEVAVRIFEQYARTK